MSDQSKEGIVAFAFGVPSTLHSNICVGQVASIRALRFGLPIFRHFQIPLSPEIDTAKVTDAKEPGGSWLNTYQVAAQAIAWAKKRGITTLWVAAAAPHIYRCVRDLKRLAQGSILIRACPETNHFCEDDWFRPESQQKHTRSPSSWEWRESIVCSLPWWLYTKLPGGK